LETHAVASAVRTNGHPDSENYPIEAVPAVRLIGVRKSYHQVTALHGVDLEIARGEFFTMLGPSGSGKTTLLRIIAGFEKADAGEVLLHGQDVSRTPPYERDVNTVFQDYALFPHMSVRDNVEYGLRVKKVPKGPRRSRGAEALAMVGLEGLESRKPAQLSGGQRQRVALARAIVNHPQVLLLDEPLGALDLKLRQSMQMELKRIQREAGITFVYVTHDQEEALTMSDHIAVLNRGRIEQVGTPVEVYEAPATEYVADFIGVSNLIERHGRRLSVRPERLQLLGPNDEQPSGAVVQRGIVRELVYLGMVTRFTVELETRERVIVVQQNAAGGSAGRAEVGERVSIAWYPEQAHNLGSSLDPPGRTPEEEHS
jgi:putative spermidine/putrescine transport system ATP-binding protein